MITEELGDGRFGRPISLAAPAGSVIFMHCITPHASLPNRSARARRTLIFEYRAGDSHLYHELGHLPERQLTHRFC
jgi:ectoine hydroxylase-related dioxygenase (phytanoyl-CoA dioxygenase family)